MLLQVEDFAVRHDDIAGLLNARNGRHECLRSRAEQQVHRIERFARAFDLDAVLRTSFDFRLAPHDAYLVGFHGRADASDELLDYFILALDDLAEIERRSRRAHSVLVAVLGVVVDFRAVKQRLGRDAAFVEAYAAQFAFLEQHDVQPFGSGAFRSHVASGTSADNC